MTSKFDKRYTQINFEALGSLERHPQPSLRGQLTKQEATSSNQEILEHDVTKVLMEKRARSPDEDAIDHKTGLKHLKLVHATKAGLRAHEYMRAKLKSPWCSYDKIYQLRLGDGDRVTVAERKEPPSDVVTVRSFSGPKVEDKLRMLQQIQHTNFVSALEIFKFEESFYVIFEHMPISLHYIAGNPYINELRLAAILGQVYFNILFPMK